MKMKNTIKKGICLAGLILPAIQMNAQTARITDAALKYQAYELAMAKGNFEDAKSNLTAGRTFINEAALNETTSTNTKMYYYRGVIHYSLMELSMLPNNEDLAEFQSDSVFNIAKECLTAAYTTPKSKQKSDASDFVKNKSAQMFNMGLMMNEQKKKAEAAGLFAYAYKVQQLLGLEYEDARKNTSILGSQAINGMIERNQLDSALNLANALDELVPKDLDLIIAKINISLKKGDAKAAEKYLADAIEADPKNKQLYYFTASNYYDLKEYEKAENYLNKALEIDPKYADAQYQLGAILVAWAGETKTEANNLKFGDPNYDVLVKKADDIYKRALIPLEQYIAVSPNDKTVLTILFQINKSIGNTEKALEYKKRADAIQ